MGIWSQGTRTGTHGDMEPCLGCWALAGTLYEGQPRGRIQANSCTLLVLLLHYAIPVQMLAYPAPSLNPNCGSETAM